jgi:cysteinyl-tRNA synthetase
MGAPVDGVHVVYRPQSAVVASPGARPTRWVAVVLALIGLALGWQWRDVPLDMADALAGNRPLLKARSWHYQLDKVDVDALAKVAADVLVTDYAREGGRVPLDARDVSRLKFKPDGSRRLAIAYLSIGEAERYRFYFDPAWKTAPPVWLGSENCSWPQAHKVRFWYEGWRDVIYRGPGSYLQRIVEAGFDGVYLDRVDIYEQWSREHAGARADMIGFVEELSATAKRLKPGFLVIPQNADDLLADRGYRRAIDGLGREDLLYGTAGTAKRNPEIEIIRAEQRLGRLRWAWKPVFVVEYLQDPSMMEDARREFAALGYISTFQPRALDGSDPTRPAVELGKDVGTAEFTARNCNKDNSW